MLKTTVIHLTVNSDGPRIGGALHHTPPATPAHQAVVEAISAAFAEALEKEGAKAANGLASATLGDRAAMATRLNLLLTTIIHLTVNSNGREIGGVLQHSTPATPAHQAVLEAISAAFSQALEKEGANASKGIPDATLGDRAAMATRLNLLLNSKNPKPYNDGVLDCINALKKN